MPSAIDRSPDGRTDVAPPVDPVTRAQAGPPTPPACFLLYPPPLLLCVLLRSFSFLRPLPHFFFLPPSSYPRPLPLSFCALPLSASALPPPPPPPALGSYHRQQQHYCLTWITSGARADSLCLLPRPLAQLQLVCIFSLSLLNSPCYSWSAVPVTAVQGPAGLHVACLARWSYLARGTSALHGGLVL